jgi:hypothetical protein
MRESEREKQVVGWDVQKVQSMHISSTIHDAKQIMEASSSEVNASRCFDRAH